MITNPPWNAGPTLSGKEAERRALRAAFEGRQVNRRDWAAGILTFLFIGLVVFLLCVL